MRLVELLVVTAAALAVPAANSQTPIPDLAPTTLPAYIGAPAKAHPLPPPHVPQNPSLAANPFNNVHNDTWMSDVYEIPGPLGREPAILSSRLEAARRNPLSPMFTCGCITFDSRGRLVATCIGRGEASLVLLDPMTLDVLAFRHMDVNPDPKAAYGSAYMYLDNLDRAVVTMTGRLWVVAQNGPPEQPGFADPIEYDLSPWLEPGDAIQSVVPDWQGRLWFVTRQSGIVGVFDTAKYPAGDAVHTLRFSAGEEIGNSFPVTPDAAYVVTTKAMYRLTAGADGVPRVVWASDPYQNNQQQKPGQLSAGSGTSPTILDNGKYVAITDNADQMHIVVYRTALEPKEVEPNSVEPVTQAPVCEVAIFKPGAGATENSLVGLGRSLIVVNDYGYSLAFDADANMFKSTPTVPGVARVDIDPNGKDCHLVWENETLAAPQVAPKMSTRTGLLYLFTRKYDQSIPGFEPDGLDVYYWTAVDFRTGAAVWEQRVGTGPLFDSYVPGPVIGPTGALYVGTYGGLVAMRDTR